MFFAVRVRVVKIADSPMAPVFDVLERPNGWDKEIYDAAQSGSRAWLTEWRETVWSHIAKRHPGLVNPGRKSANFRFEVEGLAVSQYLAHDHVGIFFPRHQPWTDEKKALAVTSVKRLREETSEDIRDGGWSGLTIATHDQSNWDEMADWLHKRRQLYERVVREVALEASVSAISETAAARSPTDRGSST